MLALLLPTVKATALVAVLLSARPPAPCRPPSVAAVAAEAQHAGPAGIEGALLQGRRVTQRQGAAADGRAAAERVGSGEDRLPAVGLDQIARAGKDAREGQNASVRVDRGIAAGGGQHDRQAGRTLCPPSVPPLKLKAACLALAEPGGDQRAAVEVVGAGRAR